MESFDIVNKVWHKKEPREFELERESFESGGFRDAFKALSKREVWVVKKFQIDTWEKVKKILGDINLKEHTRKQIQLHLAAKAVLQRL